MFRTSTATVTLSCVLILSPSAYAQGASPAEKGKAIGETINAAITAAIPGGQAIATLLQGVFGNQAEKKVRRRMCKRRWTTSPRR